MGAAQRFVQRETKRNQAGERGGIAACLQGFDREISFSGSRSAFCPWPKDRRGPEAWE